MVSYIKRIKHDFFEGRPTNLNICTFSENDEGDEDDYNRTLKDVSLMEDFTLDDDTPTTLPKDPFPPISGQSTLNDPSINSYKPDSSLFVATLQSVLGDDEKLVKALEVYNHNTPDGQKTILIRDDEETNENPIVERHSDINSSQKHSEDTFDGSYQVLMKLTRPLVTKRECRGYIRVVLNLRRPINVQSGTRPPSTYTIVSSTRGMIDIEISNHVFNFHCDKLDLSNTPIKNYLLFFLTFRYIRNFNPDSRTGGQ